MCVCGFFLREVRAINRFRTKGIICIIFATVYTHTLRVYTQSQLYVRIYALINNCQRVFSINKHTFPTGGSICYLYYNKQTRSQLDVNL